MGRAWSVAHPEERRATWRAWRAANHDLELERRRAREAADPTKVREQKRAWRAINIEKAREQERVRYAANPAVFLERSRASGHRRRQAQVDSGPWVRMDPWPTDCQRCRAPIAPALRYPDPLSESIGHEPPLAWLREHPEYAGPRLVRPEHLVCNHRKHAKPDWERTEGVVLCPM